MQFDTVDHIAIIVSDYEKSKDFYVNKLGFRILAEHVRPDKGDVKLDLEQHGCVLQIFSGAGHPERPSYPEACGLRHLAFHVADVEAEAAALRAIGIETEEIRLDPSAGANMTFFHNQEG